MTTREQAFEYVARAGAENARNSVHYRTAIAHCHCGDCFCCFVVEAVRVADGQRMMQDQIDDMRPEEFAAFRAVNGMGED
jgi:hypothetical protein